MIHAAIETGGELVDGVQHQLAARFQELGHCRDGFLRLGDVFGHHAEREDIEGFGGLVVFDHGLRSFVNVGVLVNVGTGVHADQAPAAVRKLLR